MLGCRLPIGRGTTPVSRYAEAWLVSADSSEDSRLTSTRWPSPVRSRCRSAARMPSVACSPVTTSTSATPGLGRAAVRVAGDATSARRPPARSGRSRAGPRRRRAEAGDGAVDERGLSRGQLVVAEAEAAPWCRAGSSRRAHRSPRPGPAPRPALPVYPGRSPGSLVAVDRQEVCRLPAASTADPSCGSRRRRRGARP